MLENAAVTVEKLATILIIGCQEHQRALEVKHDHIIDYPGEHRPWGVLCLIFIILLKGAHFSLHLQLLGCHKFDFILVGQPHSALLIDQRLGERVPIEWLLLEHRQEVIEALLWIGVVLVELVSEVFPLPRQHCLGRQAFLNRHNQFLQIYKFNQVRFNLILIWVGDLHRETFRGVG